MMDKSESERSLRSRLNTQIHRRKKAKAFSPLLPEWEETVDQSAPDHLRMKAALMAPTASPRKPGPR